MKQEIIYIGCYTPAGEAGIKVVEFDNKTGQLNQVNSISVLSDSSFLQISIDKKKLFAVSENEQLGDFGCFDIQNPINPVFINKQSSLGGAPCHISLTQTKAFVSNYMSGNLSAFTLTEAQLPPAYAVIEHHGHGADPDRQESAHVHASCLSVDEQFLVVADLGIDALKVYKIAENKLNLVFSAPLLAGDGPRHLCFNERGDKLYLANELSSMVVVFNFNQLTGELVTIQRITSLPESCKNQIAEITLSKDGSYLYVSNRGHDSIAVYCVDHTSGLLSSIDFTKTDGFYPRHFALSPNQQWLLVAHQNSEYLTVFKRDEDTGLLTKTDNQLAVQHAVCVCFL